MLEGIDLSSVGKGSVFEAKWLSERFGISVGSREYPLRAIAFANALELALRKDGRPCTCRTSHDSVVVLTDDQASKYNADWYDNGLNRARKCHRRMKEVDTSNLTFDEAEHHRRAVGIQGVELSAIRKIRKLSSFDAKALS